MKSLISVFLVMATPAFADESIPKYFIASDLPERMVTFIDLKRDVCSEDGKPMLLGNAVLETWLGEDPGSRPRLMKDGDRFWVRVAAYSGIKIDGTSLTKADMRSARADEVRAMLANPCDGRPSITVGEIGGHPDLASYLSSIR